MRHVEAYDQYVAALLPIEYTRWRQQVGHLYRNEDLTYICEEVDRIAARMLDIRECRFNSK